MRSVAAFVLFVTLVATLPTRAANAETPARQYDTLWQQSTPLALREWSHIGVAVAGSPAVVRLARGGKAFRCWRADIDGGMARYDPRSALCSGTDPGQPHARSSLDYNGGAFLYGVTRSPVHRVGQPINHVIVSWDAATPAGTWLELHIRVQEGGRWTHWYDLPVWASGTSSIHRHSINGQHDRWGGVSTDTFSTAPSETATAYQLSVTLFTVRPGLSPALRAVDAIASFDGTPSPSPAPDRAVWGTDLPVPPRSQMLPAYRDLDDGGGGEARCSPTSTDMILAYWAQTVHRPDLNLSVPTVAAGTYDATYDGGNWPFNTAYAVEYGLTAYVTRLYSLSQVERWVQARVPIAISIAFAPGELPRAPISSTDGHLLVVRGFTRARDPIVNDPAADDDAAVRIVYPRVALERAWQQGSHGTAYVIFPAGWHVPVGRNVGRHRFQD